MAHRNTKRKRRTLVKGNATPYKDSYPKDKLYKYFTIYSDSFQGSE